MYAFIKSILYLALQKRQNNAGTYIFLNVFHKNNAAFHYFDKLNLNLITRSFGDIL